MTAATHVSTHAAAPAAEPTHCTQTEFAALLGVGKSYVTALKGQGRIVFDAQGRVDVVASRAKIKASTGADGRAADTVMGPQFSESKDRNEHYTAELQRLKFEREIKSVLEAADVLSVIADAATVLRTRIESRSPRLSPQIAAMAGDEQRIRALLSDDDEQLLAELAEHFGRVAALAPTPAATTGATA